MPAPTTTTTTTTTTTAAPGPWMCTTLVAGPLANNCYCVTISGLQPSTCYEYRSVFVVSGTCYCACDSRFGMTQPIAMSIPLVTTGIAPHLALTDGYMTCCHTVDNNGNSTIQEYGILYTANPSYNGDATLIYGNVGANVFKTSICGSISVATPYSAMTTGLPQNTVTYYRAFAKNTIGVGDGCIYSKITASLPPPTITETYNHGTPGGVRFQYFEVGGTILAGDIFTLTVYSHSVSVTAVFGDGPLSIVNKLIVAINATTAAQWNDHGSAPAPGTPGFKPTATLAILGAIIVLTLNYQNQFGASAYRP